MGSKSEAELAHPLFRIRPGTIIPCDFPQEWPIMHFHVFDSLEGVVFDLAWKLKGIKCNCGSILMLED